MEREESVIGDRRTSLLEVIEDSNRSHNKVTHSEI